MITIIYIVGLVAMCLLYSEYDHYRSQIYIGLCTIVAVLSCHFFTRRDKIFGVFFFVVSMLALYRYAFPFSEYLQFGYTATKNLKSVVSASYVYFLLFVMAAYFTQSKARYDIFKAMVWLGVIDAHICVYNNFLPSIPRGILMQSTLDGCLIALSAISIISSWIFVRPLGPIEKKKIYGLVVCLFAIFLIEASTPIFMVIGGALASVMQSLWLENRRLFKRVWPVVFSPVLLLPFLPFEDLNDANGRLPIWKESFTYFMDHGFTWLGYGMGSFEVFGPAISKAKNLGAGVFIWTHNEYLQIFFEMGIVGFAATMIFYISCLFRSVWENQSFCFLVAIGIMSLTINPLRLFIFSLMLAMVIGNVLEEARNENKVFHAF